MSVLMQGPCRPKAYDTRPTRNGSVLPVLLTAADADSPADARTCSAAVHDGRDVTQAREAMLSRSGAQASCTHVPNNFTQRFKP